MFISLWLSPETFGYAFVYLVSWKWEFYKNGAQYVGSLHLGYISRLYSRKKIYARIKYVIILSDSNWQ
jgi:hypothetical protein